MNVKQIRETFEGLIDDSVDNSLLLIWINEAQDAIASEYGVKTSKQIIAVTDVEYPITSDFLRVLEVRNSDGEDYIWYNITEWGDISFADDDTYTIHYLKTPTPVAGNNDIAEPSVHDFLHSLIPVYAAAKFYDRESLGDTEESQMANKLMGQFEYNLAKRVKALKNRRKKAITFI